MRISKLVFLFLLPYACWSQSLGFALEQIEAGELIKLGLNGAGVKIGIIDGGFLGANHDPSLSNHFSENRVSYYKDFISPEMPEYGGSIKMNDDHGTEVWQLIGGIDPKTGVQHGLATEANYYLARTDHDIRERREEERFLIQAMDEMISLGVKVFNISLGYTNGFDNSDENYSPSQIDGRSTWITRSMDSLLAIHDVLVITSAGNDGDTRWKVLSAPADSKKVISVGASKFSHWESMNYSSIGSGLDYVKPDLMCYSATGTSFSSPVITGLAACIWQFNPDFSPAEIKEILIKSSHLYPYPNNHTGYGVPSCKAIVELLNNRPTSQIKSIHSKNSYRTKTNSKIKKGKATIYHKQDWMVLKVQTMKLRPKLKIKRYQLATQSTVIIGKRAIEIIWD